MKRVTVLLILLISVRAHAGTLDAFAGEVVGRLAPSLPPRADVALAVKPRDPTVTRLASALEGLALARLGAAARSVAVVATAEAARAQGYDAFVAVEVGLEGGEVVATGRVELTERDLWRVAAGSEPTGAVAATFVARAQLDPELRAYVSSTTQPAPVTRTRRMTFRTLRGGLDLGAPLLALTTADLDGDGNAELVALTGSEVAVLRLLGDGVAVVARARLEGPPPVPRPRAPVGALLVIGHDIQARTSEHAAGAVFTFAAGALTHTGEPRDYPLCAGGAAAIVPGMALFQREGGERFLSAACGAGLVGLVYGGGALRLYRAGDPKPMATIPGVGTAYALADLDGDGEVELVAAAWRPPGTRDVLSAYHIAADGNARPAGRPTPIGPVAAVAAGDFDGDGVADLVAAARNDDPEPRYELWQLE